MPSERGQRSAWTPRMRMDAVSVAIVLRSLQVLDPLAQAARQCYSTRCLHPVLWLQSCAHMHSSPDTVLTSRISAEPSSRRSGQQSPQQRRAPSRAAIAMDTGQRWRAAALPPVSPVQQGSPQRHSTHALASPPKCGRQLSRDLRWGMASCPHQRRGCCAHAEPQPDSPGPNYGSAHRPRKRNGRGGPLPENARLQNFKKFTEAREHKKCAPLRVGVAVPSGRPAYIANCVACWRQRALIAVISCS